MVLLIILAIAVSRIVWGPSGDSGDDAFLTRDSGGVEILESLEPVWGDGEGWRVAGDPLVRIGRVEGDPAYLFSDVLGAVRLDDGTMVVGDFGTQEVRIFGPDGEHLRTTGGRGEGPGEFSGMSAMGRGYGRTAWIFDFSLRRLTWLDASGEVERLTTLAAEPPMLQPVGPLPDGTFVFRQLWGATRVAEAEESGFRRDPVAYVRFDTAGALVDTLGLFPGREIVLEDEGGRGVMSSPLFGRTSSGAIWRGGVVVGSQVSFEVELYSPEGDLRRVVRIPGRDLRLTRAEVEAYIELRAEAAPPEERVRVRRDLEAMPVPRTRPAYGALEVDPESNLWVSAYAPYLEIPESWTVLDEGGRWLGAVPMPLGFYPWQFGDDWVLGVETDDLGVEYVALYPLLKE